MASAVRELVVLVGLDYDQQSLKKLEAGLENLKTNLLGIAGVATAAAATLFGFAKATADAANETRKAASEIGVGTNDLQALGYLAESTGASFEDMTGGLRALVQAMNAARLGSGTQADAFRRLGIQFKGANGELLPVVQVYKQLADRMAAMQDGTKKTAIATDILGGSAGKLLETLSQGSGAIGQAGAELESFGGIIDEAGFKAAQAFSAELFKLMAQVKAIGKSIGFALLPPVQKAISMFRSWIMVNKELIKSRITQFTDFLVVLLNRLFRVGRSVVEVMTGLYRALEFVLKPFGGLVNVLKLAAWAMGLFVAGRVIMALGSIVSGVMGIGKAFTLVNAKALLIPILIAAAAAAIYLIVDDIVAFVEGRPSFLGWLLKNKDKIFAQVQAFFAKVRKAVGDFVEKALVMFFKFFGVPEKEAREAAKRIRAVIEALLGVVIALFVGQGKVLLNTVTDIVQLLVDLFTRPAETFENLGARIGEIFANIAKGGLDTIGAVIKELAMLFGMKPGTWDKLWGGFKETAGVAIDWVFGMLGKGFDLLKNVVVGVGDFIFFLMSELVKGAVLLITKPFEALKEVASRIFEGVKGVAGIPKTAFDMLTGKIPLFGNAASPTASPGSLISPSVTNSSQASSNVQFSPTINVTAPPGADGTELGNTINRIMSEEWRRNLRQSGTVVAPAIKY